MQTLVVSAPGDAQDEGSHTLSSSCCGPEDLPPSSGLDTWTPGRQLQVARNALTSAPGTFLLFLINLFLGIWLHWVLGAAHGIC